MKKIVILFDLLSAPPPGQNYRDYEKDASWDSELDVKRALQRLGHEVVLVGVFDDLSRLISELKEIQPDLVFNLAESFNGSRKLEASLAGVLELLDIPYTGTSPLGLRLCQDKALSKKILNHHRIKVPAWQTSKWTRPLKKIQLRFPAFVKPLTGEGSEGIAKDSFVDNETEALERIAFLHERFKSDVIIEEFIPGREIYISVMGSKRLKVFPAREILFKKMPEDEPKFATYRVKWDEAYRKKWGVKNDFAKELPESIRDRLSRAAKKAFEVLALRHYARFDFRYDSESNEVYLLEANPNPSIISYDDFAQSAGKDGISYDQLIQKILQLSLSE